jgi:type I restriction enzyme R subunit
MSAVHQEQSFESAIETSLLGSGWLRGTPSHYNADLGLETAELFAFIGGTQAKQWEKLLACHGNDLHDTQRSRRAAEGSCRPPQEGHTSGLRTMTGDAGVLLVEVTESVTRTLAEDVTDRGGESGDAEWMNTGR